MICTHFLYLDARSRPVVRVVDNIRLPLSRNDPPAASTIDDSRAPMTHPAVSSYSSDVSHQPATLQSPLLDADTLHPTTCGGRQPRCDPRFSIRKHTTPLCYLPLMPLHRRTTDSVRSPQWNAAIFAPPVSSPPTWFVPTFAISTHGASCRSVRQFPGYGFDMAPIDQRLTIYCWVVCQQLLHFTHCCPTSRVASRRPLPPNRRPCSNQRALLPAGVAPRQWPGQKPTAFLFPLSQEVSTFCSTGYRLRHAGFSHIEHPTRRAKISGQRSMERIECGDVMQSANVQKFVVERDSPISSTCCCSSLLR
jgi:hypothetical protein